MFGLSVHVTKKGEERARRKREESENKRKREKERFEL
jgi:hypothetical protein